MIRDYPGVAIPIFETVLWREPGPYVLKFKEKWGVGIWAGRDNLADMHIILIRQGALTARSIPGSRRGSRPATFDDSQKDIQGG